MLVLLFTFKSLLLSIYASQICPLILFISSIVFPCFCPDFSFPSFQVISGLPHPNLSSTRISKTCFPFFFYPFYMAIPFQLTFPYVFFCPTSSLILSFSSLSLPVFHTIHTIYFYSRNFAQLFIL